MRWVVPIEPTKAGDEAKSQPHRQHGRRENGRFPLAGLSCESSTMTPSSLSALCYMTAVTFRLTLPVRHLYIQHGERRM
jgi:hypothetical protein